MHGYQVEQRLPASMRLMPDCAWCRAAEHLTKPMDITRLRDLPTRNGSHSPTS
jgi:hypothetical protein